MQIVHDVHSRKLMFINDLCIISPVRVCRHCPAYLSSCDLLDVLKFGSTRVRNTLDEARNLLVRRWGEMGGYWGINRTMAEIHALLFVTREPLCTDDIMAQLHISRGNASMNLRALVDWGLIQRVHKFGDRKEYFQADTDVWHMFETIMRERRRREVEPIIATIDRCCEMVAAKDAGGGDDSHEIDAFRQRVEALRQFLTTMGSLFDLLVQFGPNGAERFARTLGDSVAAKSGRGRKAASAG
jgi:DNA-binding transcriptional regulator GbsR (MarR family)